MKISFLARVFVCAAILASGLAAQVVFYPLPTRYVGQKSVFASAPNLLEGRELNNPQGIAFDATVTPPRIYVADTFNNRVLGWSDAYNFANGAKADVVIGQRGDFETNYFLGPASGFNSGLHRPATLAVDPRNGNLFVYDSGHNRILRFPRPFADPDPVKLADLAIGQPTLSGRTANAIFQGESDRINARNLTSSANNTIPCTACLLGGLAFDKDANLWAADPGNHRVLRYPAAAIGDDARQGQVAADLVLGQTSFSSNAAAANSQTGRIAKEQLRGPTAVAVDQAGNVFVSDDLNRVLVYRAPILSGKPASRFLGIPVAPAQNPTQVPEINEVGVREVRGIVIARDMPILVDTLSSRIMRFDPYEQWTPETIAPGVANINAISPVAKAFIGQDSPLNGFANRVQVGEANASSLAFPSAIAVAPNGDFYVADASNHRVLVFGDLTAGPTTAPAGGAYTARRVLGQDVFFSRSPNLIEGREISSGLDQVATNAVVGSGLDIAIDYSSDPPRMYVLDGGNNRILGFADARRVKPGDRADLVIGQVDFLRALANSPNNDRQNPTDTGLVFPTAVYADGRGDLWVADRGNGRIVRFPRPFDRGGDPQRADLVIGQASLTTRSTEPTARTLGLPHSFAFTVEGDLVVSDAAHNRVLYYRRPFTNGMAASLVLGQADFNTSAAGSGPSQFNSARGIALDSDDRLYVCDYINNRIQIFERVQGAANGATASSTVRIPGGPASIAISQKTGEIWVAEYRNSRALLFPAFNQLILNPTVATGAIPLVAQGSQPPAGSPVGPFTVRLDQQDNLYIADLANRIGLYVPAAVMSNSASGFQRFAPGMIATLYFQTGAPALVEQGVVNGDVSWPKSLADVEVLIDGKASPIYYIYPRQVAIQIPTRAPSSGVVDIIVQRASTGQPLAASGVRMETASPAFFTSNQQGTGQVAAVNENGTINSSTSNPTGSPATGPADRGKVISFYLTGQGVIPGMPEDGQPASGLITTPEDAGLRVVIGSAEAVVQYSGLAPGYVGLWQINAVVPANTAPLPNVPVVIQYRSVISNQNPQTGARITTTIAVR
jgi:uncharacterized protein (TIGR03437 family)